MISRWVRFEEKVEEGGERWSKPHVSTLSLHSFFQLRSMMLNGTVALDIHGESFVGVMSMVLSALCSAAKIQQDEIDRVLSPL